MGKEKEVSEEKSVKKGGKGKGSCISDAGKKALKRLSKKKSVEKSMSLSKAMKAFQDEDTVLFLNKGKGLPSGTIRDFEKQKFQKRADGSWVIYKEKK